MARDDEQGGVSDTHALTMLRTMQQHHVQLSAMADQKASILMGGAAVILTLAIPRVQTDPFGLPLLCVAVASFLAAIVAISAIVPLVRPPAPAEANLLFFGGFQPLDEDAYQTRMLALMRENAAMERAMLRDVHQLGHVIGRKYRLVGHAYRIFLAGLVGGFVLSAWRWADVALLAR